VEYQDVLMRSELSLVYSIEEILGLLRYFCSICHLQEIFYLWRPLLKDPKDDMLLELAVAASSRYVITHNLKDFGGCERFGVEAIAPKSFIERIGD
jgi:predicted nucleic acid-binding protein